MEQLQLLPSAPILIESTRSIGYSFEAAVADIIDNSISSRAKNIYISYQSIDNPFLCILDDGVGMDKSELEAAMRYGSKSSLSKRNKDDLGRFGLGLKVASLSQCRCLTVLSRKNNFTCAAAWDLNLIEKTQDWILSIYNENEVARKLNDLKVNDFQEGTIIVWEDFDRLSSSTSDISKIFDEKIAQTREHLSLVFHRYIESESVGKNLNIFFNNEKIVAIDPFLTKNSFTQILPVEVLTINKENIHIRPYILPYSQKISAKEKSKLGKVADLRRNQGFYIYRNKRLIIWGTWFKIIRQDELNNLARIQVDIPNSLDQIWDIDIKKSTATLPDLIKKNLVSVVSNSIGRSEKVYKYRGRKEESDIQHIWELVNERSKFSYKLNKDSLIYKMIEELIPEKDLNIFNDFITLIEEQFPYEDVYYRYSKNSHDFIKSPMTEDQIYSLAIEMIEKLRNSGNDYKQFIKNIKYIDPFKDYPSVIDKLRNEVNDE